MKAMILAAGRGERMGLLTNHTPKPLLKIGSKTLIEYSIEALAAAGIDELVINVAYLGEQIMSYLGDGDRYGVSIAYSRESEALETAGGIIKALPLLGPEPFVLVNADVWTDYDFHRLRSIDLQHRLAYLVLVPDCAHNRAGDFALEVDPAAASVQGVREPSTVQGKVIAKEEAPKSQRYTFAGISVLHPRLFHGYQAVHRPLPPILHQAVVQSLVLGELYFGEWRDIGTAQRLEAVRKFARQDDHSSAL